MRGSRTHLPRSSRGITDLKLEHAVGSELLDARAMVCHVDATVGCHRDPSQVVELPIASALIAPFKGELIAAICGGSTWQTRDCFSFSKAHNIVRCVHAPTGNFRPTAYIAQVSYLRITSVRLALRRFIPTDNSC